MSSTVAVADGIGNFNVPGNLGVGGTITTAGALSTSGAALSGGAGTFTGAVTAASLAASGQAGIGYGPAGAGTGATVAQATSRSTGVIINAICGTIVTNATSLAALASVTFTVTNSSVAVGDVVVLSIQVEGTALTTIWRVTTTAAGSFKITGQNNSQASTADAAASTLNFVVIKAVST